MKHHIEAIIFTAPAFSNSSSSSSSLDDDDNDDDGTTSRIQPDRNTMRIVRRERLVSYEDSDDLKRKINALYFGMDESRVEDTTGGCSVFHHNQDPRIGCLKNSYDDGDKENRNDDDLEQRTARTYSSTSTNTSFIEGDHADDNESISFVHLGDRPHQQQQQWMNHQQKYPQCQHHSSDLQSSAMAALTAAKSANPVSAYSIKEASQRLHQASLVGGAGGPEHYTHNRSSKYPREDIRSPFPKRRQQRHHHHRPQQQEEALTWKSSNAGHHRNVGKGGTRTIPTIPLPSLFMTEDDSRDCSNNYEMITNQNKKCNSHDQDSDQNVPNNSIRDDTGGLECSITQHNDKYHHHHSSLPSILFIPKDSSEQDETINHCHETKSRENTAVTTCTDGSVKTEQQFHVNSKCRPRLPHRRQQKQPQRGRIDGTATLSSSSDPLKMEIPPPHTSPSYYTFGCFVLPTWGGGKDGASPNGSCRPPNRSMNDQRHEQQQQQLQLPPPRHTHESITRRRMYYIRTMLLTLLHHRRNKDWQIEQPQPQQFQEKTKGGHHHDDDCCGSTRSID
jgi:hypothetical protein